MKTIYNNIIPVRGFKALTLYPIIFVRRDAPAMRADDYTHEYIHARQQKEMLIVGFYLWYAIEWLIKFLLFGAAAYRSLSFEQEAYTQEKDEQYLDKRKSYAWMRYVWRR